MFKPVFIMIHHLKFYPVEGFLPEEDEGILESTEGIFSKGGGGGIIPEGEGS